MADFRTIDALRAHGVTRITFHLDGSFASVELGALPEGKSATKGKPSKLLPFQKAAEPASKSDLDVLDDLPEMGAEA